MSLVVSVACFAVEVDKPSLELKAKTIDGQTFDLSSEIFGQRGVHLIEMKCPH